MRRYYLRFAIAWIVGVGVGCTSAPVRYYTLTAPPERDGPATVATPAIDVRIAHATPQFKHTELMIRSDRRGMPCVRKLLTSDVKSIEARPPADPLQVPTISPEAGLSFQVIDDSSQSPVTSAAEFHTPAAAVSIGRRTTACVTLPEMFAKSNEM